MALPGSLERRPGILYPVLEYREAWQSASGSAANILAGMALLFLTMLSVQLLHSMYIDAFSLSQAMLDVIGYIGCFMLGLPLLLLALSRGRVNIVALMVLSSFVLYAVFVAAVTSSAPLVSLIATRGGMFFWLFFGLAAGVSLSTIQRQLLAVDSRIFRLAIAASMALVALAALRFTIGYFDNPVPTLWYQPVANGCTILLICVLLLANSVWERRRPITLQVLLLAACSLVVLAVAMTSSTSIVAFWLAALPLFLMPNFTTLSPAKRILFFAVLVVGIAALFVSEFFLSALMATRFGGLVTGEIRIGSVASRVHILATFWDQFAVSPVFGHFGADEKIGLNPGNYVHSIPLSLLTHTGVVGLALMVFAISFLFLARARGAARCTSTDTLATRLFFVILLLGSLYTFFSWSPFWFMLGIMAILPQEARQGVAR